MDWKNYNFVFTQSYASGYRYLDRCGEFLVVAEDKYDFIPGEIAPTGGKLSFPDAGIDVNVNAKEFQIVQRLTLDDGQIFWEKTSILLDLIFELFSPKSIERNTVSLLSFIPFMSEEDVFKKSKTFSSDFSQGVGKDIGMELEHQDLNYTYSSGSRLCQITLKPITFTSRNMKEYNPVFYSTPKEKKRVERHNKNTSRMGKLDPYGLMLETVLKEVNPPNKVETELYEECMRIHQLNKRIFS